MYHFGTCCTNVLIRWQDVEELTCRNVEVGDRKSARGLIYFGVFFPKKLSPLVLRACCLCVHAVEGCPPTEEPREAVGPSGFGYFVLENQPSVVWQKKPQNKQKAHPRLPTRRFASKKKKKQSIKVIIWVKGWVKVDLISPWSSN